MACEMCWPCACVSRGLGEARGEARPRRGGARERGEGEVEGGGRPLSLSTGNRRG